MLKFLKRPATTQEEEGAGGAERKKAPRAGGGQADPPAAGDPLRIITWNCNGLTCRAQQQDQWRELRAMFERYDPDVVCLQEVRMPAACQLGAKTGDGKPRQRGKPNTNTKPYKNDADMISSAFSRGKLAEYKVYYSLADKKYAGTALIVRTTMRPSAVSYSIDPKAAPGQHHEEGRVILAEFETFDLLNTYTPNNGWEEVAFTRRRKWDEQLAEFAARHAKDSLRPLVYVGDLNVAPEDIDLSHPEFFRNQKAERARVAEADDPRDRGQPGCTDNERKRFFKIVRDGRLVDAYRELQPASGLSHGDELTEGPHFTWRGSAGKDIAEKGKYFKKGMRIDHALVSESLFQERVTSVEILGRGAHMEGFLGSDHSPMLLVLNCSSSD